MPLPSLYRSSDDARPWSVTRAAGLGAVIGALAAVFKTLAPLHAAALVSASTVAENLAANFFEIAGVTLAFALLCAAAALLRNFLTRRFLQAE